MTGSTEAFHLLEHYRIPFQPKKGMVQLNPTFHWTVMTLRVWCAILSPIDHCHHRAGSQRVKLSGSVLTHHVDSHNYYIFPKSLRNPLDTGGIWVIVCSSQEKKKEIGIMKAEVPCNEYTTDTNLDYFINLPIYWQ